VIAWRATHVTPHDLTNAVARAQGRPSGANPVAGAARAVR